MNRQIRKLVYNIYKINKRLEKIEKENFVIKPLDKVPEMPLYKECANYNHIPRID